MKSRKWMCALLAALMVLVALLSRGPLGLLVSPLTWLGVVLASFARYQSRMGDAVQIVNRALDALTAGRLDEALTELDRGRAQGLDANVYAVHAAWISALRGDATTARRLLESVPRDVQVKDPRVASTLALWRR